MVAEDRRLRLAGYEVYRFGGAELTNVALGQELLAAFFTQLFAECDHLPTSDSAGGP